MKMIFWLLQGVMAGGMTLLAEPTILTQPTNQIIYGGSNVTIGVEATGNGSITYQWRLNGTNLPDRIITTVAGNGLAGSAGDGGPGNFASISGPFGTTADAAGNIYLAEFDGHRVRKVDTNGIISTIAGNSTNGFSGDGGAATKASLNQPAGLAVDAAGNIYIADNLNNRVRRVDTNGTITTFAGGGDSLGDGGPATNALVSNPIGLAFDHAGNLYVTDVTLNLIRKITPDGIITTPVNGGMVNPTGLALDDAGNFYIAACNNNMVLKVDTNGAATAFAGTGSYIDSGDEGPAVDAGTSYPRGIAVDNGGNVLIAAFYDNRVRLVDTNGIIHAFVGTGTYGYSGDNGDARTATFRYLQGIGRAASGDLYVTDYFNQRVREITHPGRSLHFRNVTTNNSGDYTVVITDATGAVTSQVATLTVVLPPSIETPPKSQQVLVTSNVTFSVLASGTAVLHYQWRFNGIDLADATNSSFTINVVATNHAGDYSVRITNDYGSVTTTNATLTVVVIPPAITIQPMSQTIPAGSNVLFSVSAAGSPPLSYQWFFKGESLDAQTNSLLSWSGISSNHSGPYRVSVYSPYGSITSYPALLVVGEAPVITTQPTDQVVFAGSRVWLTAGVSGVGPLTFQWQLNGTNLPNNLITNVAGSGIVGFSGEGGLATTSRINAPYGLTADDSGNFFIADTSNYRIRKVNADGIIRTVAGRNLNGYSGDGGVATNASLNNPRGVALDKDGTLYIADTDNSRIRKVDTNGIISTIAGGGRSVADGVAATNAVLSSPYAIISDGSGTLYFTDTGAHRVRRIDPNGVITTVAGKTTAGFSGDGGSGTNALLNSPEGLGLDALGNLYIADYGNHRVRRVDPYGTITTIAGNGSGSFSGDGGSATAAGVSPMSLAIDGFGDLFVADRLNNRIRRVDPYGIITTVAGTGSSGYSGDGGSATNARLNLPAGVASDSYGRILIADTSNQRVRRFGQGPTLLIQSANTNHTGVYRLVVTSLFGTYTSGEVALTVLTTPPTAAIRANSDGSLTLNLSGTPSVSSRLYATTNLTSPIFWHPIWTNPVGGTWQYTNTTTSAQRLQFYRVSTP